MNASKNNEFTLLDKDAKPTLVVFENEYTQVVRACKDLQNDIFLVSDYLPQLCNTLDDVTSENVVIIGTWENNEFLQDAFLNAGLDKTKYLTGKECYIIFKGELPQTHKNAIFVIGSDMRGCIYGVYRLSREIGVSPFYWWADVTPLHNENIIIDSLPIYTNPPSVEYRGIFINDERNFQLWGKQFENEKEKCFGSPNPRVYAKVFELLLRLNANTIWPAMHPYSTAFNKFTDENGIPYNAKLANEYGIIVGSSHCENMLRNNVGEWADWAKQCEKKSNAPLPAKVKYDFSTNPKEVTEYWQTRVNTNKDFENIFTLGMRGIHDGSMSLSKIKRATLKDKIRVTDEILDIQKQMLTKAYGENNLPPQIFVPYKEAADLYNGDPDKNIKGITLPDYVTLMWADDNHGYIRQFPTKIECERQGGNGVYYHVSYWGYPCSYLWINSTPLGMIHREFTKAYNSGIRKIFIINVGDIKPAEISLDFQMSLLYDMDFSENAATEFLIKFAKSNFHLNEQLALDFCEVVTQYYKLAITLRPEFLGKYEKEDFSGKSIYSVVHNYDEATQVIKAFDELSKKSEKLKNEINESLQSAYYQMIHYSILCAKAMLEHHLYWQKYQLCTLQQRRGSSKYYRTLSEKAFDEMKKQTQYYNKELSNGKWDKIMDPYPLKFKENDKIHIYRVPQIAPKHTYKVRKRLFFKKKGIGASAQDAVKTKDVKNLYFDNLNPKSKFIDVFSFSGNEEKYSLDYEKYISVLGYTGNVSTEERLYITPDWSKLPLGETKTKFKIISKKATHEYNLILNKYSLDYPKDTYVESDGVISIPSTQFSDAKQRENIKILENPGRSDKAVLYYKKGGKAVTEYNLYFHSTGEFELELCRIPTLNEGYNDDATAKNCNVCVKLDDQNGVVLKGCNKCYEKVKGWMQPKKEWRDNAYRQYEYLTCKIKIAKTGVHKLYVEQIDENIAFDRIVIYTKGSRNSYIPPSTSYNTFNK